MRCSIPALLLAATLSTAIAKSLPSNFNDIERRWSEGQSEVCHLGNQPGCYVLAWAKSVMPRVCSSVCYITLPSNPSPSSTKQY